MLPPNPNGSTATRSKPPTCTGPKLTRGFPCAGAKSTSWTAFEVTCVLNLGDGKTIEKVGADVRAIVTMLHQAFDRAFSTWPRAVKLSIAERYQRPAGASLRWIARVLAESMRLLALAVPPETYAQVIPRAIAIVRAEHADGP